MGILEDLFQGNPSPGLPSSSTSATSMPAWYEDFMRGIAAKGVGTVAGGYTPYPDARLAPFNDDQLQAFGLARSQAGGWKPAVQGALGSAGAIAPTATAGIDAAKGYSTAATGAVAGPAATWDTSYMKYMSPYTQNVVSEIGRLGNQNIQENLIPGINSGFIGSGGFGSTRNAEIMARGLRDAQTNISGLQSQALQSGWNSGANIFGADASRTQQQGALQSQAALGAGGQALSGAQIGANALDTSAARQGALASLGQTLGTADVGALGAVGGAQQQLQQQGLDVGYNEFLAQRDSGKNDLAWLSQLMRGQQLPTTTAQAGSVSGGYTPSPLSWLTSLYGLNRATTQPSPTQP